MADRLTAQFAFLDEADRLKSILRASQLYDGSRFENSAEHSWHIMLYALTLAEHSERPVKIDRVLKMLLLHDLVEIDAGDAPIHGDHDPDELAAKEEAAADRIFGLLPDDQAREFRSLWDEFEAAESDDAVFAKSLDRVQPVVGNLRTNGGTWPEYNVTFEKLDKVVGTKIRRGAPAIWAHIRDEVVRWFDGRR